MTYRTHLAAGYTAALFVTAPDTVSELILCMGVSTIGSVISDVDASSSESRKNLKKVTCITVAGIAASVICDYFTGSDITGRFRSSAALMRLITGFLIFLGICIFGEHQPHRSFMHSIAGTAAVTAGFALVIPQSALYMSVSVCSHILLDMLNKKKVQLFWPLKKPKFGFGICYAEGRTNSVLFLVFSVLAAVLFFVSLKRIMS
ncbi:MAG: metal-dependent hydrolase [Oscillospiraceae bacterium]|nr:metal-dependent hydrolase [Oscillospiraceae bacterium]